MDWYPPSPTHGTSGLLHVFLVSENGDVFFTVFVKMCEHLMFSLIWENSEKMQNAIPFRQIVELCLELVPKRGWWLKWCPIIVKLLCIVGISGIARTKHSTVSILFMFAGQYIYTLCTLTSKHRQCREGVPESRRSIRNVGTIRMLH